MHILAKMKDLSSTLAIEAFKENLGKDCINHRFMNRLGHIWSNQLGCDLLNEAYVYQGLVKGYLEELIKNQKLQSSIWNQLKQIEEAMKEAIGLLNQL